MTENKLTYLILAFMLLLFACGGKDGVEDPENTPKLEVAPTAIESENGGRRLSMEVMANGEWTAFAADAWIELSTTSGKGDGYSTVTIHSYDGFEQRTGKIVVESGTLIREIPVTQLGVAPSILVSPSDVNVVSSGGNVEIKVTANIPWKVTIAASDSWLSYVETRAAETKTAVLSVERNTGTIRSAKVKIESMDGTLSKEVTIHQMSSGVQARMSQKECLLPPNMGTLVIGTDFSDYTVTVGDAWAKVLPGSVNAGEFAITLQPNESKMPRATTVYVDGTRIGESLTIVQYGQPDMTIGDDGTSTQPIAFPGAEGGGRYASGGRGGKVYVVTTLEDNDSPGTFRYAVTRNEPRTVVFAVSGTIRLKKNLSIPYGNLTIAGQTAPGEGICIADMPFSIGDGSDNTIVRFLTVRLGDAQITEADAFGGRYSKKVMIDHVSTSWSIDECLSFYANEDFTLQWSVASESLRLSYHVKDSHGYGGIWGGKNASFHHNLLAHHDSRNPRIQGVSGTEKNGYSYMGVIDLRNNVIYNWMGNSAYAGEEQTVNFVNCYYKAGPATSKRDRIFSPDASKNADGTPNMDKFGRYYVDGNMVVSSAGAVNANPTNDNWAYGVWNQLHSSYAGITETQKLAMKIDQPFPVVYTTTHPATVAYERVADYAGNSLHRDGVDSRVIQELQAGTATYSGSSTKQPGIIDKVSDVGGYPELMSWPAWPDTDGDGIPDVWEESYGLDPNNPTDGATQTLDTHGKYTNLEVYLHHLVQHIVHAQNQGGTVVNTKTN